MVNMRNLGRSSLCRIPAADLWYFSFLLAQVLLIWLIPWFPTQDGPSHLYNAAILHDLLNGGKEWGEYYRYELKAVPNLGFNLIMYPLLYVVTPRVAQRLFLTLYVVLMGYSVRLLIRTFSPGSPLTVQLLAVPVMFNFTLMMGFYSYNIAVPAFLVAMALAWRVRNRPFGEQVAFSAISGGVIFFLHLIPFIYFVMSLVIFAIADSWRDGLKIRLFLRRIALVLPLMLLLAWYLGSSKSSTVPADFSYLLSADRFISLFSNLLTFSTVTLSPWQLLPAAATLFVVLVLATTLIKCLKSDGVRSDNGGQAVLVLATALTFIYFLAPFRFGGGSFFNDRFPWVILIVILPLLASVSDKTGVSIRTGLITAGVLSVAINTIVFFHHSSEISMFLSGMSSGFARGDRIILYRTSFPVWWRVDVLLHAPSYYGMYNKCIDLGNYETALPYFPVRFRQDYTPLPTQDMFAYGLKEIDFSKYLVVTGILGWDLKPNERREMSELFVCIFDNARLSIWNRR